MKRIDNPYDGVNPKTKYQWHCYWVFEDKEFQEEVLSYKNHLMKLFEQREKIGFNDADLRIKQANYWLSERNKICEKFAISSTDFAIYASKGNRHPLKDSFGLFSNFTDIKKSIVDDGIEVRFKPNISKAEYIEAWKDIEEFIASEPSYKLVRENKTKRKEEVDYQLIYAIYRARASSITYAEIYSLYSQGKLRNYKTSAGKRFNTPKELNDYYIRNSTIK